MRAPGTTGSIRVLVADDERLFAEGVMSLLGADERIEVVGHARTGAEAVELVASLQPDLVLMDIAMPGMDGVTATARIKEIAPATTVVFLTSSTAEEDLQKAVGVGAAGYLTKTAAASELVATIVELASLARVLPRPGTGSQNGPANRST